MVTKNVPAKNEAGGLKLRWEKTKQYFISVYNELKKVHWPDRRQLVAYTGVVLVAVTIVALIIWVFDSGLSFLITKLFEAFA
ncbi:MAG: preprotein translocase subunit SecE [Syntrophomonadaceae bacterium]|nr:preprotein translocase subunit SecE [Syntrophomonadaceae bacterium]NLX02113.1 preprotein translocase subunit SecE [Syntrophomonadaceae bacterium]